jgi:hypothetical protein
MASLFSWSSNWGYLVLPCISIFGFITNLLNIAVLLNKKMKDVSFRYLLATSISDCFYLTIASYIFIYECKDCPFHNTYFTQFFDIVIAHYISACLAIFNILTDIILSFIRYSVLKNKDYLQPKHYFLVIVSIFIISFLFYSPPLFFKIITPIIYQNQTSISSSDYIQYTQVKTSIGSTQFGKVTPIVLSSVRIFLAIFVLTGINILNVIEFRKRYSSHRIRNETNNPEGSSNATTSPTVLKQKQKSTKNENNQKASRNITLMIMFQCFLYTFGNFLIYLLLNNNLYYNL